MVLHERLIRDAPGERRGGKEGPFVVRAEHARAVAPGNDGEEVAVAQVVVGAAQHRQQRPIVVVAPHLLLAGAGAQVVPFGGVDGETLRVRGRRFRRPGLHREAAQEIDGAGPQGTTVRHRVLVDELTFVPRPHGGTAVQAGAGGDGSRGKEGVAPEVRVAAEGAFQPEGVADGELGEDISHQTPFVPVIDHRGDVGQRVLELLAHDGPHVPLAVAVLGRQRRVEVHRGENPARPRPDPAVVGPVDVLLHPRHTEARARAEAPAHLPIQVEAEPVPLEGRVEDNPLLVQVVAGQQVAGPRVAARQAERVALLRPGAEQQLRIVVRLGTRDLGGGVARRPARIGVGFVRERHVLRRGQHRNPLADFLNAVARLEGEAVLAPLTALRRNQDDAVGAARSVHGRGGSVLQNVDRLDVLRVDLGERVEGRVVGARALHRWNPVHDVNRLGVGADRGGAANPNARSGPGNATVRQDVDAGRLALERVRDRAGRRGFEKDILAAHRRHRACQVTLLDRAVADRHDFV